MRITPTEYKVWGDLEGKEVGGVGKDGKEGEVEIEGEE